MFFYVLYSCRLDVFRIRGASVYMPVSVCCSVVSVCRVWYEPGGDLQLAVLLFLKARESAPTGNVLANY